MSSGSGTGTAIGEAKERAVKRETIVKDLILEWLVNDCCG